MQLYCDQLEQHLKRRLSRAYFIYGGEPEQMREANTLIQAASKKKGYNDKEIIDTRSGQFSWEQLLTNRENLSFLAEKKVVEFHLDAKYINASGMNALNTYLVKSSKDNITIILVNELTSKPTAKWFNTLETHCDIIIAKPIPKDKYPGWLQKKFIAAGLALSQETIQLLAEQTEGNATAAMQILEKLKLHYPHSATLTIDNIRPILYTQTEFSVYDLANSALAGDLKRTFRIFLSLKNKRVELNLILWVITTEIRKLLHIAYERNQVPLDKLFAKHGIWQQKKSLVRQALDRLTITHLENLIFQAIQIDKFIKQDEKVAWLQLQALCMQFADIKTPIEEEYFI